MSEAWSLFFQYVFKVWTGKTFFFLLARLHGVTTLKTTVQITSTVDFKPNDSPLSMITGYFVPAIKSRDGHKDVSLTF